MTTSRAVAPSAETGHEVCAIHDRPGDRPAGELAAQDVFFLITGGLLTCLIGFLGLMGFMGWIPGLHKEQKSAMNAHL